MDVTVVDCSTVTTPVVPPDNRSSQVPLDHASSQVPPHHPSSTMLKGGIQPKLSPPTNFIADSFICYQDK